MAAPAQPRIRIVVADDHPSIRENLRYLLNAEADLDVVGVARDGASAIRMALELRADVLVVDYDLPDHDGLSVARALHEGGSSTRIVLYTMENDIAPYTAQSRVDALVSKDASPKALIEVIRRLPRPTTGTD
jgi:DNA-binding NarL/FixJ family response regulator